MNDDLQYDIGIVGGGLAGLSLAILSARRGYRVILFEKEQYPFHKVCGEYISLESWDFLEDLGVPLSEMQLPLIRKLEVSAPNGYSLQHNLPQGGFGISRFRLDGLLAEIAAHEGVEIKQNCRVNDIAFENDRFYIHTGENTVECRVAAGTWGKRSKIDLQKKRSFIKSRQGPLNNYIAIKYHVRYGQPADKISLHNFDNGYCGLSQIEEGKCCLCYLTTAHNLRKYGNDIRKMEEDLLCSNPQLKKIWDEIVHLYEAPLSIAQISFAKKEAVLDHMLLIGDAAGMITPLCGNGMSMALHGSKLAFECIDGYLQLQMNRMQMEMDYRLRWDEHFRKRLRTGRLVQRFFGHPILSNLLLKALRPFPGLISRLIRSTHGQPF